MLYVASGSPGSNGSGVFQSLDNGTTWTLFPDTTYGAVAEGGYLPHVSVTDLDTSLGNIDSTTGMPNLAGPYQAFVFLGTLTTGSDSVTGITNVGSLALGDTVEGTGIPAGTTIVAINGGSITLSNNATASGSQTLAAANPTATPDPDLLLATTYGRGQFAINLAPLIVGNTVTAAPSMPGPNPGSPPIVTGPITIDGMSELSGFGNTTWISVVDMTVGDSTYNQVIAGFNPANGVPVPNASNSTDAQGNFSINLDPETAFATSHGLKTIEIYATDNAGSMGNKVVFTFDLNPATQLVFDPSGEPPATATAGQNFAPVVVDAVDTHGSIDPFFNGPVTIDVSPSANSTFPVTVMAVNGVATFTAAATDLAIFTVGTYNLTATSGTLTSATSTPITITPAAPAQLLWVTQPPAQLTVENPFGVTLVVEDQYGNLEPTYTQPVSLSLFLNGNPSNNLNGMATIPAVGGSAAFGGLSISQVGDPYTLVATTETLGNVILTSVPSSAINVVAPILVVTKQPTNPVTAGTSFQVVVTAETVSGAVDTYFNDPVGLSIFSGPNNAPIGGTTMTTAMNGVATFSGVILDLAGPYILTASSSNLGLSVNTGTITVVAAQTAGLVFVQQPPPSVQARSQVGFGVVVGGEDQFGNPTSLAGQFTLQISTNPTGGALNGTTVVAANNGVATFSGLSISVAGNPYKLTATGGGHNSPESSAIDVLPAPAVSLQVTTQPPPSVTVYQTFSISVSAYDQFGQFDPDFNGMVTVAVANGPGMLQGTLSRMAVYGVAMFSDLYLTKVANSYTLSVSSPGLSGATTSAFNVTAAAASQLVILAQPASTVRAGTAFGFVVEALDQYNNPATSFNSTVTAALATGPAGGALGGTLTATANGGVAVFSALMIDQAGSGYTIQASSPGLSSITTTAVTVTPASASQLVILPANEPPSNVTAGQIFGFTVTAEDQFGNLATSFAGTVSVGLATNPVTGATLGGTLTAMANQGVANFQDLHLDTAASGYTITAKSGTLTPVTTTSINVAPAAAAALVVTIPPPSTMTSGSLFGLQISALDPYGNLATGFTGTVMIALKDNPGGGMLIGHRSRCNAVAGVANFTAGITTQTPASGYTLQATSPSNPDLTPVTTTPITVIPVPATQLAVQTQPTSVAAGATFTLVIAAKDMFGNVAQGFNGTVSVAIASGSLTLGGTQSVTASNGIATFNNLTLTTFEHSSDAQGHDHRAAEHHDEPHHRHELGYACVLRSERVRK